MSSIPSSDALLLVRHGRTADNAAGLILGHRDPPLSEAGRAEAQRLAAELRSSGIAAVWTSPLRRAYETAAIVAAPLALEPRVCADLVESARGRWEGVAVASIARDEPALHAAFERGDPEFTLPGGESLREQQARTRAALAVVAAGPLPAVVVAPRSAPSGPSSTAGEVFSAPPSDYVYETTKLLASPKGVLHIINNYTGDRMSFDMGRELAEAEGVDVATIIVDDDVAVKDSTYTVGRRGVAGNFFVMKAVGAASEEGASLQELVELGNRVNSVTRTMGMALTSCTPPAKRLAAVRARRRRDGDGRRHPR